MSMICKSLLLVPLAVFTGCDSGGSKMYPVSGEVRYNGELVTRGNIAFVPNDPSQRTAVSSIVDGMYSLKMEAGSRKVEVMASKDNGPYNPEMGQAPKAQYIPDRYNVETELRAEITPDGENRFDFDLQPAGNVR